MAFKKYRYYIGIDAGVNTGYALWDSLEQRFMMIESMKIHTAILNIYQLEIEYLQQTMIRIEDARLRKWIPRERDARQVMGRAKGAGSVMRDASVWEDYLTDIGANFQMVAPKFNKTKTTADYFKKLTKWEHKTNEHERDAALLVFGM